MKIESDIIGDFLGNMGIAFGVLLIIQSTAFYILREIIHMNLNRDYFIFWIGVVSFSCAGLLAFAIVYLELEKMGKNRLKPK